MAGVNQFVKSMVNDVANSPLFDHHDETQPLLHDQHDCERQSRSSASLPKAQLVTLCAIRLADPIAFTQVFPYVNEMMERFGVATDPTQTGFYSGLVESAFAFAQLLSIYYWASLSDRVGRRPVILVATAGMAITTVVLGFSRTLQGVLVARALAGIFSGNVAVMHSVLAEITDSSNQALAYPIFGLCWPFGVILGPLIGGAFSTPTEKYPFLSGSVIFTFFPYLLPCLVVAFVTLMAVLVGYSFLEETLPTKVRTLHRDYSISYGLSEHNDDLLGNGSKPSAMNLLRLPVIRSLCLSGCALSFIGTAFDVVFVLFCYSPVKLEGSHLLYVSQIGYALALAGVSSATIQLLLMPILLRLCSPAKLYKACMFIWPFTFMALPLINHTARLGVGDATEAVPLQVQVAMWTGIGVALTLSRVACLAYSLNMILVKEHAPGPTSLGSVNGLAQAAQCLARAIAPTFVSCLFAYSVGAHMLQGNLWMIVMSLLSFFAWASSLTVPVDLAPSVHQD